MNLVSIVMPAFNAERHVSEAVESVLAQSYRDWELLVVDDCSTDSTAAVVQTHAQADSRIRRIALEVNSGPAAARNAGISLARGRYIAFLDSDDVWLPKKLETQVGVLEASGAALVYSAYVIVNDKKPIGSVYEVPESITYRRMLRGSVIGCSTVVYDASILGKRLFPRRDEILQRTWYGWFIKTIGHEDLALWLSILKDIERGDGPRPVGVQEPLVKYRVRSTSFSGRKLKAALFQWIVYREFERLGFIASLTNFAAYAVRGLARRMR